MRIIWTSTNILLSLDENLKGVDECNALVLPATKTKKKDVEKRVPKKQPLTKKQKKHLQKVLEVKKKKAQVKT